MALDKIGIAKRIAKELKDGYYVNLGIGIPTLVANYIPQGINVEFQSEKSGWVSQIDALRIGQTLCNLGAGRTGLDSQIDHGIGAVLLVGIGEEIEAGTAWIRFEVNSEIDSSTVEAITKSIQISDSEVNKTSRILRIITY